MEEKGLKADDAEEEWCGCSNTNEDEGEVLYSSACEGSGCGGGGEV